MRFSALLFALFRFLVPPALILTAYLYLYPAAQGCAFPEAKPAEAGCLVPGQQKPYVPSEVAPFRLLALGDPQLEGDTSLPNPDAPLFPSLRNARQKIREWDWEGLRVSLGDGVKKDLGKLLQGYRKRLDLWGNDLYLAHIYRSVSWWTEPTHTVVLGDLLGSQWIGDEEFQGRTDRFWGRVFKGAQKVPRNITDVDGRREVLGKDDAWRNRIIAVVGNHDIGYAGDINGHRIERFEDAYGRVNWDIRFRLESNASASLVPVSDLDTFALEHQNPELHLIMLNSMNLDDPAFEQDLQQQSRDFVDAKLYGSSRVSARTGTILLTHIPFHKEAGVCVDAPFFSYFPDDQGGGIKEQNHLSKHVTNHILNGLARPDRGQSIVLNGHDHEGCDTYHYNENVDSEARDAPRWRAGHYFSSNAGQANESHASLREITVRSMMGSFGGNAGLLSAWFDFDAGQWRYEYDVCVLGVQHIWWAVHVLDLVVIGLGIVWVLTEVAEALLGGAEDSGPVVNGKMKKA